MSISTEISRIQSSKSLIRTKLIELGLATSVDNLDTLASAINDIVNQGAVSITVKKGETATIPAGYHNGSGTVTGISGENDINLQSKSVTPSKKQQSVTADSGYSGLSSVTVAPIPDIYQDVSSVNAEADKVLTGQIFVTSTGAVVPGTMLNHGAVSQTLDVTSITYVIPQGYHNGEGKVTITLETKVVTPTKETQTIVPTEGKVLSQVTVEPIPEKYVDTSSADAEAKHILIDKTAYVGTQKVTGTMPNNGSTDNTIDGITKMSVTIPAGYTSGGTVSLTNDIEEALAAI